MKPTTPSEHHFIITYEIFLNSVINFNLSLIPDQLDVLIGAFENHFIQKRNMLTKSAK